MSVQLPHTRLINAAARDILHPIGLTQKGRSRTWLDDRGWWLGVVEFQPSSWSRGSYLNVGVNWLWNEKNHLSFDIGYRVKLPGGNTFIEYRDDQQFAPLARKMAIVAAEECQRYRGQIDTVQRAALLLGGVEGGSLLASVDAGVALGICGETAAAQSMFSLYLDWFESDTSSRALSEVDSIAILRRREIDKQRHDRALLLNRLAADPARFRREIADEVRRGRALLKLEPDVELPF